MPQLPRVLSCQSVQNVLGHWERPSELHLERLSAQVADCAWRRRLCDRPSAAAAAFGVAADQDTLPAAMAGAPNRLAQATAAWT